VSKKRFFDKTYNPKLQVTRRLWNSPWETINVGGGIVWGCNHSFYPLNWLSCS